jgi:hypothetical protein
VEIHDHASAGNGNLITRQADPRFIGVLLASSTVPVTMLAAAATSHPP